MKSEHELQHRMKTQIGNTFVNVSLQEVVAHFLLLLRKKKKVSLVRNQIKGIISKGRELILEQRELPYTPWHVWKFGWFRWHFNMGMEILQNSPGWGLCPSPPGKQLPVAPGYDFGDVPEGDALGKSDKSFPWGTAGRKKGVQEEKE